LVSENYEVEDNVIDSSNSVMARNLYVLSIYFGLTHYEDIAQRMKRIVISNIDYPSAFSNWLNVFMNWDTRQRELAICGENALESLNIINSNYLPQITVAATESPSNLPFLRNRYTKGVVSYYVCKNKVCDLPIYNIDEAINQLK